MTAFAERLRGTRASHVSIGLNGGKVPWSGRSCSTESRMTRMERELMKNGMTSRMAAGAFVVTLAVSACANDDDGNTNLDPDTDDSMTDDSMTDDSR